MVACSSSSSVSTDEDEADSVAIDATLDGPNSDGEPVDQTSTDGTPEDIAQEAAQQDSATDESGAHEADDTAVDLVPEAVADDLLFLDSEDIEDIQDDTQSLDTADLADLPDPPDRIDEWLARCPSAAQLDAVDDALLMTFEDDPTTGELVCLASEGSRDMTRLQKRGYQAVILMTVLTFDEPLPWTEQPLGDWFSGAITGIRFREGITHNSCCSPADTINIKIQSAWLDTDLWVNPRNGAGVQGLVAVMVHEARHNESKWHNCGSNDTDLAYMGAWAVEYYFLWWVAYHADPCFIRESTGGSYYGTMARSSANSLHSTRFCDETTVPSDSPPSLPVCAE